MATWILPANTKYYDIERQYKNNDIVEWTQKNNFEIGDIVFIYLTKPRQEIVYKCKVIGIDILEFERINDDSEYCTEGYFKHGNRFVRLKYICEYKTGTFTYDDMKALGLNFNFQSAMKASGEILAKLNQI